MTTPKQTGTGPHNSCRHDDVIKWKHFPRKWPFVRGIHWSPVNSPHKGQWRGVLMFSLIYAWIKDWVNNREAGDLRHHRGHYDVIVMYNNPTTYSHVDLTFCVAHCIILLGIWVAPCLTLTRQFKWPMTEENRQPDAFYLNFVSFRVIKVVTNFFTCHDYRVMRQIMWQSLYQHLHEI